jgi:hypothetical protein
MRIPDPEGEGPPLKEMVVQLQREGNLSDDRIRAWRSALQSGGGITPLSKIVKEVLGVTLPKEEDNV